MLKIEQFKMLMWVGTVLWMAVIFGLSSQVATTSNNVSHSVSEKVVQAVKTVVPPVNITADSINHLVRKYAHFIAYAILGIWLSLTMIPKSRVISIGVIYAISDELHQMFVPGRGPSVKDVLIDSSGVIMGLCVYGILRKVYDKVKH